MNNKAIWQELLKPQTLSIECAELLCTAALTNSDPWLISELWTRWDTLDADTQARLSTTEACIKAASSNPGLLSTPVMTTHPKRATIVASVGQQMIENIPQVSTTDSENNMARVLQAASDLGDDITSVNLLANCPALISNGRLSNSGRGPELMAKLICTLPADDLASPRLGTKVLTALSSMVKTAPTEGQRGAAAGMLSVIVQWDEMIELIYSDPEALSGAVLAAYSDPTAQMTKLMSRICAGEIEGGKVNKLLANRSTEVARLVLLGLPWNSSLPGLILDNDDRRKLDARKVTVAASELSGNLLAQEMFWALTDGWAGTVSELVDASQKLTADGTVARKADYTDTQAPTLPAEGHHPSLVGAA
jgi:hypothetical protein